MKRLSILIITLVFIGFSGNAFAQENDTKKTVSSVVGTTSDTSKDLKKLKTDSTSNWKFTGSAGLNSAFTTLTNWAAGGNNSSLFVGTGNLRLIYQKDKFAWETAFETELGYTYIDKATFAWRKSNDKINFASKAGYDIGYNFYITLLGAFRSQYVAGYDYPNDSTEKYISNWLAPSYTDLSLGIDWKPNDIYSIYLSPAAGRLTTATDATLREKYGVALDKSFKAEFGAMFKGALNYQYKQLKVVSALTFFTPYSKSFGNVDVDWDLAITYQLLKAFNISLGTSMKYYDAVKFDNGDGVVRQHVQFKTLLGVGIGYSF